ncbi:MAG: carbohydrate-binding protein [Bacillota bacterium]|nr:carbohydrate-binding protein [Bacillota bacterium]
MPRASSRSSEYLTNGITLSPAVPSAGDTVRITYDGILSKSGATDVFAHIGYGNKWDKVTDYRMHRTTTGFETAIAVNNSDTMNLCFKDCANNWDNNSGKNYSFDVSQ